MNCTQDKLKNTLEELFLPYQNIKDASFNGLQVHGNEKIDILITGVTSSLELIQKAQKYAKPKTGVAILVHHGLYWEGQDPSTILMLGNRLRALVQSNINLFAYHLPLDLHPTLGNNVQLAKALEILDAKPMELGGKLDSLIWKGSFQTAKDPDLFASFLHEKLDFLPLWSGEKRPIKTLAFCSGAAHRYLPIVAAKKEVDAYLSGEISEPTYHQAVELDLPYIQAGHHSTERFGIKALGEYLEKELNLEHINIDIPIPV